MMTPCNLPIGIVRPQSVPFTAAFIIPTGIGAHVGGFGGDGAMALNLLSKACDRVVTHPNVANAAVFQNMPGNVLYCEGYALDEMLKGQWALRPMANQHIGVILDSGIPADMMTLTRNAIAACQTIYGVPVAGITETREPLAMGFDKMASGNTLGQLGNPDVLLGAAHKLLQQGATAIAVAGMMPAINEDDEQDYRNGAGADPIGALEALVSHTVVSQCQVPAAHAPVLSLEDSAPETSQIMDPRLTAEFIAQTFIPCILTGLMQAPNIITNIRQSQSGDVTLDTLHAIVVPADCLGGIPALTALENRIPLIVVKQNTTTLNVSIESLFNNNPVPECVIPVQNYAEAAGILLALKHDYPLSPAIRPYPAGIASKSPALVAH